MMLWSLKNNVRSDCGFSGEAACDSGRVVGGVRVEKENADTSNGKFTWLAHAISPFGCNLASWTHKLEQCVLKFVKTSLFCLTSVLCPEKSSSETLTTPRGALQNVKTRCETFFVVGPCERAPNHNFCAPHHVPQGLHADSVYVL